MRRGRPVTQLSRSRELIHFGRKFGLKQQTFPLPLSYRPGKFLQTNLLIVIPASAQNNILRAFTGAFRNKLNGCLLSIQQSEPRFSLLRAVDPSGATDRPWLCHSGQHTFKIESLRYSTNRHCRKLAMEFARHTGGFIVDVGSRVWALNLKVRIYWPLLLQFL